MGEEPAKPLDAKSSPSLGAFSWDDPFLLEDQLGEDERMIRDSAKAFAESELLPRVSEAYLNETSAPELFPLMGEVGLLGSTIPETYGGIDAVKSSVLIQAIAR